MSPEGTVQSWTLEEWKRLSEHPSPFVRLWVAKTAPNYLDRESRSPLLRRLLYDKEPQIGYYAEQDLLDAPFPDLGDLYLDIALQHATDWDRVSSALHALAAIGDGERLISWLNEMRGELATFGPDREFILRDLCLLPGYLALLDLDKAEPVAEELLEMLQEAREEEEGFSQGRRGIISHALAGLLLSHPRPREVLDFLGQLDIPLETSESLAEIMGDSDWANSLLENRDDSEEPDEVSDWDIWDDPEEDEEELYDADHDVFPEEPYDEDAIEKMDHEGDLDGEEGGLAGLNPDFLQKHLSADFLSDWKDHPLQRPWICLQHAARLMRDSPFRTGDGKGLPGSTTHDFCRLERAYTVLEILADPDLPSASRPEDLEECALLLLVLIFAGRSCIGRSEEDFSREKMLTAISRDRPDMLQDRRFAARLKSGTNDVDASFREMLLDRGRSALSEYDFAWTKRVLDLAPAYGLEELIPDIVRVFQEDMDDFIDGDISFLENTLVAFGSPRIWEEHLKQSEEQENSSNSREEMRTWQLFLIQKAPCHEALEWLRTNQYTLIRQDETGTLRTVRDTGDPRFIPVLQPLLAEDEDFRGEVFQTLCRLHGDDRAFSPEEENLLWERSQARHQKMLEKAQSILRGIPRPSSPQRERVQLCCDDCGGVFHYQPERIVIYPQEHVGGDAEVDIGGDLACKSCGAPVDRLCLTVCGRDQIADSAMPSLSQLNVQADMDILGGKESTDKQILVCPKGQMCLGETVNTMSEGLEKYDRRLATDPQNVGLLVGKANLLTRLVRMREAETYYRRALQIDCGCIDALAGMYDLCNKKGREEEAWDWLQQSYSWFSRGTVLLGDPNRLKRDLLQEYTREASKRGMAPEQPLKSRNYRVKRNDPCPCGSGKKYKKCCLEK